MSDYIIVDIEDPEVDDLINGFSQLTINRADDSPTKSDPIIHSNSGSSFEVIQNDAQVARDTGSIQDQRETFSLPSEEIKEGFFENNNREIMMIDAYGRDPVGPVDDLEMAKLQQNEAKEDHLGENQMEDLRNEKVKLNIY